MNYQPGRQGDCRPGSFFVRRMGNWVPGHLARADLPRDSWLPSDTGCWVPLASRQCCPAAGLGPAVDVERRLAGVAGQPLPAEVDRAAARVGGDDAPRLPPEVRLPRGLAHGTEADVGVADAGRRAATCPAAQVEFAARPRSAHQPVLERGGGIDAVLEACNGRVGVAVHHLPDVARHVVKPVAVGLVALHRLEQLAPLGERAITRGVVIGLARGGVRAPRILRAGVAAARGVFELRRGGQAINAALVPAAPLQVCRHVVAVHEDHRMVFHAGGDDGFLPMEWGRVARGVDEQLVLGVGHGVVEHFEIVHPHGRGVRAQRPALHQDETIGGARGAGEQHG